MPVTYQINPVAAKPRKKRSRRRRVLKWAAGVTLAFAVLSSAGGHSQPPRPVAVHQAAAPRELPVAAHAAAHKAKSHHLLRGALRAHRLVHVHHVHRPFWRIRRVRRWFR